LLKRKEKFLEMGKTGEAVPHLVKVKRCKKWECLNSDTGEDLAEEVRKYHLHDFSNWKNHAALARVFARLEKDLRPSLRQITIIPTG
jgi:hypothetical protein